MWVPQTWDLSRISRNSHFLFAIGRIKPGVTLVQAQSEIDAIAGGLEKAFPDSNTHVGAHLVPLREELLGDGELRLYVLLAAVVLVLLVGCANLANLLLSRATSRQREIAVRAALGAGRARLIQQLLTESVLLAVLGGGFGILLAVWGLDALLAATTIRLPRPGGIQLDTAMLAFAAALSLLTGLVFGLVPALTGTRVNLNEMLKEGGRGTPEGRRHRRLRGLLVVSEISMALVLLVGAGLLAISFWRLAGVSPGFTADSVLTLRTQLPASRYREPRRQAEFTQRVLERVAALPGVEAAGAVSDLPFSGSRTSGSFSIEGQQPDPVVDYTADSRRVTPGYFRAMSIPLLRGRGFTDSDGPDAPGVALVNEAFVRRFLRDADPLGRRIRSGGERWWEIVGVVGDVRHDQLRAQAAPEMYFVWWQWPSDRVMLAIRLRGQSGEVIPAVRAAAFAVDPGQPVFDARMMGDRLADAIAASRINAQLLGVFAVVALLLAAVGIYGVVGYNVTERTHEIGVRVALGAQREDILGLVVRDGMRLAFLGVAIGLGASLALARFLESLLFGVQPLDPLTIGGVALVLMCVAFVACWVPARRATRVDPLVALRYE
jgi:putative ABC transport system permease protein